MLTKFPLQKNFPFVSRKKNIKISSAKYFVLFRIVSTYLKKKESEKKFAQKTVIVASDISDVMHTCDCE